MTRSWPLFLLAACTTAPDDAGDTDTDTDLGPTSRYDDDALWACLPGSPDDVCARDRTATELRADGSSSSVSPEAAENPPFDCFYVYPTVDLTSGGLDTDFSEVGARLDPLLSQAAPFTSVCRVFAPYYRQVALNAFEVPGLFDTAYGDVKEAFEQFQRRRSKGRPYAIVGHSQGTAHLVRLLQEEIEPDEALHGRLVTAVLLGGRIQVPQGEVVGGTFTRTPACTSPGEGGCLLAWATYAAEDAPGEDDRFGFADPGYENVCTDPILLAGRSGGRLAGSWFATTTYGPAFLNTYTPYADVPTPYVRIADRFDAACVSKGGAHYLEVTDAPPEGDARDTPPYRNTLQEAIGFGMHTLDYDIAIEDLVEVVGAMPMP